jgi:hypothetical protein
MTLPAGVGGASSDADGKVSRSQRCVQRAGSGPSRSPLALRAASTRSSTFRCRQPCQVLLKKRRKPHAVTPYVLYASGATVLSSHFLPFLSVLFSLGMLWLGWVRLVGGACWVRPVPNPAEAACGSGQMRERNFAAQRKHLQTSRGSSPSNGGSLPRRSAGSTSSKPKRCGGAFAVQVCITGKAGGQQNSVCIRVWPAGIEAAHQGVDTP